MQLFGNFRFLNGFQFGVSTRFPVKTTTLRLPSFHERGNRIYTVVYPYGNLLDFTFGNNKKSKHNCFRIAP